MKLNKAIIGFVGTTSIAIAGALFLVNQAKAQDTDKLFKVSYALTDPSELQCIKEALWYEARSEQDKGMRAVASVILHRTQHEDFKSTVCGVVKQPRQFSYRNAVPRKKTLSIKAKPSEQEDLARVEQVIDELKQGKFVAVVPSSVLWFSKKGSKQQWMRGVQYYKSISKHSFYATK